MLRKQPYFSHCLAASLFAIAMAAGSSACCADDLPPRERLVA